MKRIIPTIIIAILALSCVKETPISRIVVDDILTKGDIKEDSYAVTDTDIKNYIHFKQLENPELQLKNIEPFEYEGQTLLYVLNYNKGWEVISADKRTQVVLGCGEEGSFTMKDYEVTPWGTWVYTLAMDVLQVKRDNPQVKYNENADYEFWGHLGGPLFLPPPDTTLHDFIDGPLILEPNSFYGHYVLSQVDYIYDVDSVTVSRLTTTHWRQNGYTLTDNEHIGNYYVPLSPNSSEHVPSGCTAVAGAQLAYYLHNKYGEPSVCAVYDNECINIANNTNDITFTPSDFRTDLWTLMNNPLGVFYIDNCTNTDYSDMLIAYVGRLSNTEYNKNGSGASLQDFQTGYLGYTPIASIYSDSLKLSIVLHELSDSTRRVPVMVSAYTAPKGTRGRSGHTFLIDGCQYSRKKPVYTYEWQWYERFLNGNISNFIPWVEPLVEEGECEYQRAIYLRMNWGYSAYCNDYTFAPYGSWQPGEKAYNHDKEMLYGFRIAYN